MLLKPYKYVLLFLPLFFVGCDELKWKDTYVVESLSEDAKTIYSSMGNVSKEDARLMYMQFGGLSKYMSVTTRINTTVKLLDIIHEFQSEYGYTKEKYKDYTDAVEVFLMKKGYEEPKDIVNGEPGVGQMNRQKVVDDMQTLADAAKMAMEKK